ncbi:MAG: hypothetical protein ACREMD_13135 [Gemmatimonadota bacterium]
MRGSIVLAAVGVLILAVTARAQQEPTIPEGYIGYLISGPGINAPPLPFKIEGDRIVAPNYNSGLWTFTVELPEEPIS